MTAASPPALLPCPLCQSVNVFGLSWACCTDCDCSAPIAAWNRRAGTAELVEALRELSRCATRMANVTDLKAKHWQVDMQLGAAITQADAALAKHGGGT